MTDEAEIIVSAPPAPKDVVAVQKLEVLLDKPVPDHAIPTATEIRVLPDGGIRVGKFISIWQRIMSSTVMWVQAAAGILATAWLTIPQETFTAVIPTKYAAWGTIVYAIVTALARMRTI